MLYRRAYPIASFYALALLAGRGSRAAEDNPNPITVTTASQHSEEAFASPRAVDIVSRRRIEERGVSQTPEALGDSTGVYVQRTNSAGGSPIIRGLLGQHVLLLVDGVRLNTAITRFGPNQLLNTIDPFSIQRIEILRGPGSVLHGSDAIGGVVNVVTRRPQFDPLRAWDVTAEVFGGFESASSAGIGHTGLEGHLRGLGMRVGGTLRRFGDLRAGRDTGQQPFTGYWEGDADVSASWQLGREGHVDLSYNAARQHDAPSIDRATSRDFLLLPDQLRNLWVLNYEASFDSALLQHIRATVSYHLQRELRERLRTGRDAIEREQDDVGSTGGRLTLTSVLPYNRLTYGVDIYHDRVHSDAETEATTTGGIVTADRGRYVDGSSYTQVGVYLMDHIAAGHRLAFDVGGRAHTWIVHIPADPSDALPKLQSTEAAAVGSVHARYLLGDGLNVVAGVSQGFRAPNVDDYSARGCSGQGFDVPNFDLNPEKSITAEGGVKIDVGGLLSGGLFYAYTHLDDLVIRRPLPGQALQVCGTAADGSPVLVDQTRRENAQHGYVHTAEAQLSLTYLRWELFGMLAWTRGSVRLDQGRREPMRRIPPLNGLAGLRYSDPLHFWFGEIAVRWAAQQDRLADSDRNDLRICPDGPDKCEGTAAYAALNLRAGIRPTDRLRLLFALANVFDETYRVHGSGIDAPGINASVSLEMVVP